MFQLVDLTTFKPDSPTTSKAVLYLEVLREVSSGPRSVCLMWFVCANRLTGGGRMLWWLLLICLLPQVGCSRIVIQDIVYKEKHSHGELEGVNVALFIYILVKSRHS